MTTSADSPNRWAYTGDDSTTAFAYESRIFAETDLNVYIDGELQASGYTVSGVDETGGGNVTFDEAPETDAQIVIVRQVPSEQGLDMQALGSFPAEENEKALDRLTILVQQLEDGRNRSLRQPDTDTVDLDTFPGAATRRGMILGFEDDEDAQPTVLASAGELQVPIPVAQGGTGATDAAGALTALGAEPADSAIVKSDESKNLSVGYTTTSYSNGTVSSGTLTPDPANGNIQHYTNNGAHTLAPPSTGSGDAVSMFVDVTNGAAAGAISTGGWTITAGDTMATTNGLKYRLHMSVGNAGSRLTVEAMQP